MPVFYDEHTPKPWMDPTVKYDLHDYPEDDDVRNGAVKEGHIYMDAMGFGMGSCCLQITFQAKNITEGRTLYDQLCPLGPIMLALSAATPIFKGFLADVDCRWNVISAAVDDRTEEERGLKVSDRVPYQNLALKFNPISFYSPSRKTNSLFRSRDTIVSPCIFPKIHGIDQNTTMYMSIRI